MAHGSTAITKANSTKNVAKNACHKAKNKKDACKSSMMMTSKSSTTNVEVKIKDGKGIKQISMGVKITESTVWHQSSHGHVKK